ncbi:transmembrane protein 17-like [Ambystoma mexicanum]|uniref:transmembrane protein 17-like n=1 Tax=Ambystoma mexicanum TaxID=8296 RepID=UPI0037E89DB7
MMSVLESHHHATHPLDNDVVSSLPLQMSLYFNAFYFPFWWVCDVVMLQLKYSIIADYYKFILVTILILVSLIEAIRLYLGYTGNLQEKVPELAGFWLLSLLLQFPLVLFLLLNEGLEPQPLERATNIIFVLFLVFQVLVAFITLKRMVNHLATRFHLRDFDRLEGGPDAQGKDFGASVVTAVLPGATVRPMEIGWGSGLRS